MNDAISDAQDDIPRARTTPLLASLGYWSFRNRSWLPVPLGLAMLAVKPDTSNITRIALGIACVLTGQVLRLWAVRHIGGVSRTRTTRLGPLVSTGPYAHTRNPIYTANWFLWTGVAVSSCLDWMIPLTWAMFAMHYGTMVRWEEHVLARRHPGKYDRYAADVPRWWPRIAPVETTPRVLHTWPQVLFSERGTIAALAVIALLLAARRFIG
ncbi:MAG TPA: isoprenylcysteine carboxylmethyltransferase family protein [Vicinamibacterales bacterium]|nr:isoprenylcysteine carboxylmethyltransferase family protein [Vicinamibacterales bacterium]